MARVETVEQTPKTQHPWTEDQALELWRHYAGVGGADKNTMVTIASWLLTFSATIIGYVGTKLFDPPSFAFTERWKAFGLAILGLVISGLATYIAVLYGGYAVRNWAEADRIARKRGWKDLLDYDSAYESQEQDGKPSRLFVLARSWARPTDHITEVPPVFKIFAALGLVAGLAHLSLLIRSLVQILWK